MPKEEEEEEEERYVRTASAMINSCRLSTVGRITQKENNLWISSRVKLLEWFRIGHHGKPSQSVRIAYLLT